jgi:rod shape determining protein RodA
VAVLSPSLVLLIASKCSAEGRGAHRWLDLKIHAFPAVRLVKLTLPMMAAWYCMRANCRRAGPRWLPRLADRRAGAADRQGADPGHRLLVAASGVSRCSSRPGLVAHRTWRSARSARVAPLAWHFMHEYQRNRLRYVHGSRIDPLGNGWHSSSPRSRSGSGADCSQGLASRHAVAAGVPARTHDRLRIRRVFEEWGLVGVLLLLALYILSSARSVDCSNARGHVFAPARGSISMAFFVYVMVNGGMITGLLPVVGVPLPLISYGGTSAVSLFAGFGVLIVDPQAIRRLLPR